MPDTQKPESFLIADIGSVNTKVGLVDRVGDAYRFVGAGTAATTAEPPTADVLVGIRRAVEQLQARTDRRLLTDDAQLITPERASGQGVDAFVAVTSAPIPLRVAIVGLSREVSVASAARAVTGTYATIVVTLALDETGGRWLRTNTWEDFSRARQKPASEASSRRREMGGVSPSVRDDASSPPPDPTVVAAEKLAAANPDVIVLVGGIDGGATTALYEIANLVAAIAAAREEGARPHVIFAGNREVRPQIAARVGQVAPLRVVDNVHPAFDRENPGALQRELEALYVERKIARGPGWGGLANWTPLPVLPTARAFENVVRFLSRRYALGVWGADVGGATTTLITARGEAYTRVARGDLGVGHNLEQVLASAGVERLLDWLPTEMPADDALAHCLNHSLRPTTIPATREEAHLLQAAARHALAITARQDSPDADAPDLIVLSGGLMAHNTNLGALALLALDALQPRGVFTLAIDPYCLAPALGALAALNAEAAAGVIERDGFVTLGTVIAPTSAAREGQVVLRVKMQIAGSGAMNLEVPYGALELIPLAPGQKAALEVRPAGGVSLGQARRGVFKAEVEGGALGLLIDARGRPIALPPNAEKRRAKMQEWFRDLGS